jgi:hypothetical protein
MEQNLFLFDTEAPGAFDRMRDFLSQSIEDIERQWQDRAAAREKMITNFFDIGASNAGVRAARIIRKSKLDPQRMPECV